MHASYCAVHCPRALQVMSEVRHEMRLVYAPVKSGPVCAQVPVVLLGAAALYALITRKMGHQDAATVRGLGLDATPAQKQNTICFTLCVCEERDRARVHAQNETAACFSYFLAQYSRYW